MPFADEPVGYPGRCFECGWSERAQSAIDIAVRVQELAHRLGAVDPSYERIRPDPGMRTFGVGDLGPVLEMTSAELAALIDRQGRSDPPSSPAPVGPGGYDVLYRNDLKGDDPSFLSVWVRAGKYGPDGVENRVRLQPEAQSSLWRDPEQGVEILDALIETWGPEWVCAYALRSGPRPWLAWTAKPLRPRPNPPWRRPYPAPFPLDAAGAAAEERSRYGGQLLIWP